MKTKIRMKWEEFGKYQNVGALEVAMNQIKSVNLGNSLQNLLHDTLDLIKLENRATIAKSCEIGIRKRENYSKLA